MSGQGLTRCNTGQSGPIVPWIQRGFWTNRPITLALVIGRLVQYPNLILTETRTRPDMTPALTFPGFLRTRLGLLTHLGKTRKTV